MERFGIVSREDVLKSREERFKPDTTAEDEKKRKRLEKFGPSALVSFAPLISLLLSRAPSSTLVLTVLFPLYSLPHSPHTIHMQDMPLSARPFKKEDHKRVNKAY